VNRTERIPLQPTRTQRRLFERMLWLTWTLYNAALQERRDAWRLNKISIGVAHQMRELLSSRTSTGSGRRSFAGR
jgi:hypothetical protein